MILFTINIFGPLLLIFSTNVSYATSSASPIANGLHNKSSVTQLPAKPFYLFPNGKQAENIKVRSNGQILVTLDTAPELYQIDPSRNQTGGPAQHFSGYSSLFGIVELIIDVFYVIASNFSGPPDYHGIEGSVSLFEVDLQDFPDPTAFESSVRVSKIVDVPEAQLLDGLAIVNQTEGLLISGDAPTGTLYLLDVKKRTVNAVCHDELLEGTSNSISAGLGHVGVNGLQFRNGVLFFTNTAKGLYGQIPIDSATGGITGEVSIIADYGTYVDDLSFDSLGNQFIAEDENGILLRPADATVANNRTRLLALLPGADSSAFGRTAYDRCTLYATYAGSISGVASIDVGREGYCN